jgi:hypothetical protein
VGSRQQVPGKGKRVLVDQQNPRNFPPGDLRVSDADRDLALAELSEHFQAGRLTADEMHERTGRTLTAKTGKELSAILADLPVVRPGAGVAPVSKEPERRGLHWTPAATAVVVSIVAVAVLAGGFAFGRDGHYSFGLWPIVLAFFVLRQLGRGGGHGHDHHQQHPDRRQEQIDRHQERHDRRRDLD